MSTFDRDDDVRREESDELHGHGGWYEKDRVDRALGLVGIDTDPTPPHGIERQGVEQ